MRRPPGRPRRAARMLRHPGFAAAFAVLALLVYCWPIVRAQPPHLVHAALHLFAAWAVTIAVLAAMSRQLRDAPPEAAPGEPDGPEPPEERPRPRGGAE